MKVNLAMIIDRNCFNRDGVLPMCEKVNVKMLGSFSIAYGDGVVTDQSNRMRKVWLLLAYLICNRKRVATQEKYISLLNGAGVDESADPNGKLKAMFYRARTMLNQVDEAAGHDWIIRKNGTYAWNENIPLVLDVEEFENICKAAANESNEDQRLALYKQAIDLYRGDFLSKLSMEPWVMPLSAYYHQMYLDAVEKALVSLNARGEWKEIDRICQNALKIEPYSEELYQHLMRCRIALEDRDGALRIYEEMSELLFATFGVMPSDESRALYREANKKAESVTVPVGDVRDQLREPFGERGAMYCEYDFFKMLYQLQARTIVRSGEVIHIALFSVHCHRNKDISRRSLDIAMDNLQEMLINNLRQGDVVTRCSVSQLIVMLPQANYENSCTVCQRILKAFNRQYPHSPADIHYSVQPLEPKMPEKHN